VSCKFQLFSASPASCLYIFSLAYSDIATLDTMPVPARTGKPQPQASTMLPPSVTFSLVIQF
jgi:hypothetical protein